MKKHLIDCLPLYSRFSTPPCSLQITAQATQSGRANLWHLGHRKRFARWRLRTDRGTVSSCCNEWPPAETRKGEGKDKDHQAEMALRSPKGLFHRTWPLKWTVHPTSTFECPSLWQTADSFFFFITFHVEWKIRAWWMSFFNLDLVSVNLLNHFRRCVFMPLTPLHVAYFEDFVVNTAATYHSPLIIAL